MDSHRLITIKELAEGLHDGQSRRGVCPWCNGGHSNEVSFVVRNISGTISYKCYRATCAALYRSSGRLGTSAPVRGNRVGKPAKSPTRPYKGALEPLPGEYLTMFRERFGLKPTELSAAGFKYAPDRDRIYMPVYGPNGRLRGAQLRSYDESAWRKADAHPETNTPWQGFYQLGQGRPTNIVNPRTLVVVEDQVSAIKVARYYNTMALLGTNFTGDKAAELAGLNARNVLLALDEDATGQAIDIMRRNMLLLKGISVVLLERDFKDAPDAEIIQRIKAAIPK